ncbi:peptide chain release factor N(5)-glutamine methyltransferase [Microlunatus parietis]|uniref:Release factor glutamine methyltransferase n=1 Tax=Microlunatus parietis TaxID=682979 RepID=A0A7Y9LEU8_9ACTN|nr:peptide chain release factor N(5)-glutamine methyltransferase [Microlunatus parietis]NYE75392.1 release factor glutamine methyltransferase [Microlunatus parietis]
MIMDSSVRTVLAEATDRLREAGVPSPDTDARLLLAHAAGFEPSQLLIMDRVDDDQRRRYLELIIRRARREPLQHLTGRAFFRHVELAVGPGVFVPRPETEVMTGWAVERLQKSIMDGNRPLVIELGTGSGAIAKALADEAPGCTVIAVERDHRAAEWAAGNLAGTGVELIKSDMAELPGDWDGRCDLVISNPPYIPWEAYESVAPEARDHDPELALYSGADGLDAIRVLTGLAARLLKPGGLVATEHSDLQGEAVVALFAGHGGFGSVRDHRDLTGRSRFTTAVRDGSTRTALAGWAG